VIFIAGLVRLFDFDCSPNFVTGSSGGGVESDFSLKAALGYALGDRFDTFCSLLSLSTRLPLNL